MSSGIWSSVRPAVVPPLRRKAGALCCESVRDAFAAPRSKNHSRRGLRTRCEALAREHGARQHGSTGLSLWFKRFAPTFAIALVLLPPPPRSSALATQRSDALLAAQLTADHMKCFRLFAAPKSAGLDAGATEKTLQQTTTGWDVHVPPSSQSEGVTLVGARRCLYADGQMPHVMYRVNGQNMSLFVLDGVTRRLPT